MAVTNHTVTGSFDFAAALAKVQPTVVTVFGPTLRDAAPAEFQAIAATVLPEDYVTVRRLSLSWGGFLRRLGRRRWSGIHSDWRSLPIWKTLLASPAHLARCVMTSPAFAVACRRCSKRALRTGHCVPSRGSVERSILACFVLNVVPTVPADTNLAVGGLRDLVTPVPWKVLPVP